MQNVYEKDEIIINNENTLILGADYYIKKQIKKELAKKYSVVDNNFSYTTTTVGETIENYNFNLNYIKDIKEKNIKELTFDEYYYLAIILKINTKPEILIIDNLFGYLNNTQKDNVIKTCETNDIKLIIFDNELYHAYMNYQVIVIHDRKVVMRGSFNEVVLEDRLLKKLGYEIPFYIDLSIQLKLYGLVGNVCYSLEELEANLWN